MFDAKVPSSGSHAFDARAHERRQTFMRIASGLEAERAAVRRRLHEIDVRKQREDQATQERKQVATQADVEARRLRAERERAARDEEAKQREVRVFFGAQGPMCVNNIFRRNVWRAK